MSAILVKMPPAIRSAAAPSDSPIAKPMKHLPASRGRHEQHDRQHDHELGRDQQHADGDPGLDRDRVDRERLRRQRRERGPAVGQRVDADAEPRDQEGARDAHQREHQDERHVGDRQPLHEVEVADHDHRGERLKDQQELALRDHVRLAGLVDQLADLGHRAVDGQAPDLAVEDRAEDEPAGADGEAPGQQRPAGHGAEERHQRGVAQVRQHQVGLADVARRRERRQRRRGQEQQQPGGRRAAAGARAGLLDFHHHLLHSHAGGSEATRGWPGTRAPPGRLAPGTFRPIMLQADALPFWPGANLREFAQACRGDACDKPSQQARSSRPRGNSSAAAACPGLPGRTSGFHCAGDRKSA